MGSSPGILFSRLAGIARVETAWHFVGFYPEWMRVDPRYQAAVRAFGQPDFIHRVWDARAVAEVVEGDIVVFAEGDETQPVNRYGWDDSHADIVAHGGSNER